MDKLRDTLCIEKYKGNENEDFLLWSLGVMAVLEVKGNHEVVDGTEDEPPMEDAKTHAKYTEKARMARAMIVTTLGDRPLTVIKNAKTPK